MSNETETDTSEQPEDDVSDRTTNEDHEDPADQSEDDALADDGEQGDDEDADGDDDLVEVEWEGKTVRVTPEVKSALLRQADYTRKTQDLSDKSKALEAERQAVAKLAERAKEVSEDRIQYRVIESQLKALDALDWDKLEQEDPEEANRLFRQRQRIRDRQIDLAGKITEAEKALDLDRQRGAREAHAKSVQDCQAVLAKDIKGWGNDLATKVGEFAIKQGWTPQEVLTVTDPKVIKALHAAYVGDLAQRKLRGQSKLEAGDKTPPVSRPGGGGQSPNARRTTDASGDKLSTAEWMAREHKRVAAQRTGRR